MRPAVSLGHKIVLVQGDSQCTPVEGVLSLQRMISSDQVQFVLGDICSSATVAYSPIVENAKVLLLNAASSDPTITLKAGVGGYQWTFRSYPTDEQRAGIVLEYAAEKDNIHKVAILALDNDYGRGAIALSKRFFDRYGITAVSEDYFQVATTEFLPGSRKIKSSGAQAILMYGYAASARLVARQMLEAGPRRQAHADRQLRLHLPGRDQVRPERTERRRRGRGLVARLRQRRGARPL